MSCDDAGNSRRDREDSGMIAPLEAPAAAALQSEDPA